MRKRRMEVYARHGSPEIHAFLDMGAMSCFLRYDPRDQEYASCLASDACRFFGYRLPAPKSITFTGLDFDSRQRILRALKATPADL
jgi:hypothetical protein